MKKLKCQNKLKEKGTFLFLPFINQLKNRNVPFILLFWISCFGICDLCFAQDKIVAIVNNEIITQRDLSDFVNFMRMRMLERNNEAAIENKIKTLKTDLLDRLIEDRLILQEAKKSNLALDESKVKSRINEIKQKYSSETEFQGALRKQGLVQADLETKIREQMLIYNIIDQKIRKKVVVRPDEVTNFYNKNRKEFVTPKERDLEVMLLENQDLANSLCFALKSGQRLEDLATRYPFKLDKIHVSRLDELKKEIADVVFKIGVSDVAGPISVDGKYYVFKLDYIAPEKQLPLSEVQDKIHNFIFESKMQEELVKWLDELKKQSYIKITQS